MNKDIRGHTVAGTVWKCFNWLGDKGNPRLGGHREGKDTGIPGPGVLRD